MLSDATVFVVDDDQAACESVVAMVETQGLKAEAYGSAEEFLNQYDGRAGCLIADLRMPGISGVELQEQLAATHPALPVIIISAFADVSVAVRVMQSGAITLLEKPYRDHELLDAIHQALETGHTHRQRYQRLQELQQRMSELTVGERQVLRLLIEGHTNKAIASRLDLGLRTVEKYRHNLFKKLDVNSLPELVRAVIQLEGKSNGAAPAPRE